MRLPTILMVVLLTGGCSILLAPDRDAIVPGQDGGPDAGDSGRDAGRDAGFDAGRDGGIDGGCEPSQQIEVNCSDDVDNDCDMLVDCDDRDCASDGYCCDVAAGSGWGDLTSDYTFWESLGWASPSASTIDFGTGTGQLVHRSCAPVAFGMRFIVDFDLQATGFDGDFASIVLATVPSPRLEGTISSELTLRVNYSDSSATLLRADTEIGGTTRPLATGRNQARVDVQPSVDELGRPVLLVSASISGQELITLKTLIPLEDLRGASYGCTPDGLFLAMEGRGSGVLVSSGVQATTGNCPNPTQFIPDAMGPFSEDPILASGMWRAGGAGEPSLLVASTGGMTDRLELLVDASEVERSDEDLTYVDYSIGGAIRIATGWFDRTSSGAPELFGADPSSREPSLTAGDLSPHLVVFARSGTDPNVFEIAYANLDRTITSSPGAASTLLAPGMNGTIDVDCISLRDPAAVALDDRDDLLLFFTCENERVGPRIAVAHLHDDGVTGFVAREIELDLFPASQVGAFGRNGVLSPEVVVTGQEGDTYTLRIWFVARGGAEATVGFAYGEAEVGALPRVSLYPGNPVLRSADPVLGGSCTHGCTIESLGVTATEGESPLWSPPLDPSYLFLVERTRLRSEGSVEHQLIPIRQPRPAGG